MLTALLLAVAQLDGVHAAAAVEHVHGHAAAHAVADETLPAAHEQAPCHGEATTPAPTPAAPDHGCCDDSTCGAAGCHCACSMVPALRTAAPLLPAALWVVTAVTASRVARAVHPPWDPLRPPI